MGNSPPDLPEIDFSDSRPLSEQDIYIPPTPSYRLRPEPMLRYVLLFLLTIASTTQAGGLHYLSFLFPFNNTLPQISWPSLLLHGLWYSLSILAILGCHELGHYYACRYYRVDASRPYFLPMPFLLTGTLGAFIRIRSPIPGKRALFDIGIAGPIAGNDSAAVMIESDAKSEVVECVELSLHGAILVPRLGDPIAAARGDSTIMSKSH